MSDANQDGDANENSGIDAPDGKFYTFVVDGEEYQTEESSLTGGEIMDRADIPYDVGLILIHDDGTEERVGVDEEIEFEGPGRRFKQAPQFKRG